MSRFRSLDNLRERGRAFRGGLEPLQGDKGETSAQLLSRLTTAKDDDGDGASLLGKRDYAGVVRMLDGRELSGAQANNLGIAYAHLALASRSGVDWQKAENALAASEKKGHADAKLNRELVSKARRRAA